jgi:predicted dehydrogenase
VSSEIKPVNFAYVGCGFIGQSIHIPNFRALPECNFVGLAEVREELGRSVAARYGIPKVYKSHLEIAADPSIEAVGVSAPYAVQGRVAEDLARAGKHVFMEKPMAINTDRAQAIVRAQQAGGGRVMIAYMKRYDPGSVLVKRRLDAWRASGEAGRILFARCHDFGGNWMIGNDPNVPFEQSPSPAPEGPTDFPDWLPVERRDSYLWFILQWTHNINLLRFFLADEQNPHPTVKIKSVDLDSGDGVTGIIVMEINKVRAVIETGHTRFHAWDEHTQIYFEGGHLFTHSPVLMQKEATGTCEIYRAADKDRPASQTSEYPPIGWSYREEAKSFLHHVRAGTPFVSPAQDSLEDVIALEEIYRRFVKAT